MYYGYELVEHLYSEGSSYEDYAYQKAFSDGYEYAQREFGAMERRLEKMARDYKLSKGDYKAAEETFKQLKEEYPELKPYKHFDSFTNAVIDRANNIQERWNKRRVANGVHTSKLVRSDIHPGEIQMTHGGGYNPDSAITKRARKAFKNESTIHNVDIDIENGLL